MSSLFLTKKEKDVVSETIDHRLVLGDRKMGALNKAKDNFIIGNRKVLSKPWGVREKSLNP